MNDQPPPGTHLSDSLIERFTLGEVDDNTAILAAEHLDSCPYCSARTVQFEPLATAFAHAADPVLDDPQGLVAAVLSEANTPIAVEAPDSAAPELLVGGTLLAVASVLLAFGDWTGLAAQTVVLMGAFQAASQAAISGMPSPMFLFPATALCGMLSALVIAAASGDERVLGRLR